MICQGCGRWSLPCIECFRLQAVTERWSTQCVIAVPSAMVFVSRQGLEDCSQSDGRLSFFEFALFLSQQHTLPQFRVTFEDLHGVLLPKTKAALVQAVVVFIQIKSSYRRLADSRSSRPAFVSTAPSACAPVPPSATPCSAHPAASTASAPAAPADTAALAPAVAPAAVLATAPCTTSQTTFSAVPSASTGGNVIGFDYSPDLLGAALTFEEFYLVMAMDEAVMEASLGEQTLAESIFR